MVLYCSVVCFNQERAFDIMLKRDNYFKQKPDWYRLFATPKIYQCLKNQPISPDRRQFDLITLREAFDKDLIFMVEIILERSRITRDIIQVMVQEDQNNMLVSLVSKRPRPLYVDLNQIEGAANKKDQTVQRELHFNDIIEASLDAKAKSQTIIHMIKRMKNEITSNYFENPSKEYNL